MTTFSHKSVAEVMGSWPVSATGSTGPSGGTFNLLHKTLLTQARILGARREPAVGFNLGSDDFKLTVDGTPYVVSFVDGNATIDYVVTRINTVVGSTVAFNSDGFLLLKSTTIGDGSTLLIEQNTSGLNTFTELGLFPGMSSSAGDLQSAEHVDPSRQIAYPGQLALLYGESADVNSFNRLAFQMAVNSDRSRNLLDKKTLAVPQEFYIGSYTPGTEPGVELTGADVYVGSGAAPSLDDLEKLFVVLDEEHNEVLVTTETVIGDSTGETVTLAYDDGTQQQTVTINGGAGIFLSGDVAGPVYVRLTGASSGNSILYKVSEYISATSVRYNNVDPSDGSEIQLSEGPSGSILVERVSVSKTPVRVSAVKDGDSGTRVEGVDQTKVASTAIDRIERNDRIVVEGASFVTNLVTPGDKVTISGSGVTSPYSNNGAYRVAAVVDEDTIEVVGDGWEPVFLNSIIGTGYGNVAVTSDGSFYPEPWVTFNLGLEAGEVYRVLYLGKSSFRDASTDPAFLSGGGLQYAQEAEAVTKAAIRRLAGPGTTSITSLLYDDNWRNLEDIYFKYGQEHELDTGRHSSIQPDDATIGTPSGVGFTVVETNGLLTVKKLEDTGPDASVSIEAYTDTDDTVDGSTLNLRTSYGDGLGALLATQDDQILGNINASGVLSDDSAFAEAANWKFVQDGNAATTGVPGRIEGWASSTTTSALRFVLKNSGVIVGKSTNLGTPSLADDFVVYGGSATSMQVGSDSVTGTATIGMGSGAQSAGTTWAIEANANTGDLTVKDPGGTQPILRLNRTSTSKVDIAQLGSSMLGDAFVRVAERLSLQDVATRAQPDGLRLIANAAIDVTSGDNLLGIRGYSADSSFTTENPKLVGYAGFQATENYAADTDGGAAFVIAVNPDNVGTTSDPDEVFTLDTQDLVLSTDGGQSITMRRQNLSTAIFLTREPTLGSTSQAAIAFVSDSTDGTLRYDRDSGSNEFMTLESNSGPLYLTSSDVSHIINSNGEHEFRNTNITSHPFTSLTDGDNIAVMDNYDSDGGLSLRTYGGNARGLSVEAHLDTWSAAVPSGAVNTGAEISVWHTNGSGGRERPSTDDDDRWIFSVRDGDRSVASFRANGLLSLFGEKPYLGLDATLNVPDSDDITASGAVIYLRGNTVYGRYKQAGGTLGAETTIAVLATT